MFLGIFKRDVLLYLFTYLFETFLTFKLFWMYQNTYLMIEIWTEWNLSQSFVEECRNLFFRHHNDTKKKKNRYYIVLKTFQCFWTARNGQCTQVLSILRMLCVIKPEYHLSIRILWYTILSKKKKKN